MPVPTDFLPTSRADIIGAAPIDPDVLNEFNYQWMTEFASGFNSDVYRVGEYVLKLSPAFHSKHAATRRGEAIHGEECRLRSYHSDNIPPTVTWIATNKHLEHFAVNLQPFIEGNTLAEHTADTKTGNDEVLFFLGKALRMRRDTGEIADLANVQGGFQLMKTANLVVEPGGKPWLVDTGFGKFQRSRSLGPLWNRLIARGVLRGVEQIQQLP